MAFEEQWGEQWRPFYYYHQKSWKEKNGRSACETRGKLCELKDHLRGNFKNLFCYGVRVREKTGNDSIDQRDLQFYARFLVTKAKSLWIYGSCPIGLYRSYVVVSLEDSWHITLPQTWKRWDDKNGLISYRVGFHFSGPESRFWP